MSGLKLLRNRIKSVKSTQKITKAMKMVAASKLRRAKEAAEAARPYAKGLEAILASVASGQTGGVSGGPSLLHGTGANQRQLLIVATSDRGLCGGFNSSIVRASRRKIRELVAEGKDVSIITIGRKGFDQLQAEFGKRIVLKLTDIGRKKVAYSDAEAIAKEVLKRFDANEFDVATIVYNHFKSAISQVVTFQQLVPLPVGSRQLVDGSVAANSQLQTASYAFEPSEEVILTELLPKNLAVQVFNALLENAASEQGARMSAMDNASRNAGDMIKRLNLKYNRSRQATITKELIEIISGAEAV